MGKAKIKTKRVTKASDSSENDNRGPSFSVHSAGLPCPLTRARHRAFFACSFLWRAQAQLLLLVAVLLLCCGDAAQAAKGDRRFSVPHKWYKSLSAALQHPDQVYLLDISVGKDEVLSDSIGLLLSLRELRISGYFLRHLPEAIGGLSNLEKLQVSAHHLRSLPESIDQLHSLEELWIECDSIPRLPASLGKLNSLRLLSLRGFNTAPLPSSIGGLPALKTVLIKDPNLREIPPAWGQLRALDMLTLEVSHDCRIPPAIYDLPCLRRVKINGRLTHNSLPGFILGLVLRDDFFLEIGRTAGSEKIAPHGMIPYLWTPRGLRYGLEIKPYDNFTIAAKLSWMEVLRFVSGSLSLLYYTDFHSESIRLRPEIGLMIGGFRVAYGWNLPLHNSDFEGISFDNFTIQMNLPRTIFD